MVDENVVVYIDGASCGNPGPAAVGFVVYTKDNLKEPLVRFSRYIGVTTNNVAEYEALISALKWLLKNQILKAEIYTDSELIYKQLCGIYHLKTEHIKQLAERARRLLNRFKEADLKVISRENNREANKLAQEIVRKYKKLKHV
ncbi:MAG: ribonuclease HI family protein [candidate division WOR-3 bacterium]|nr:ribonuclease HI family protein [candidate division WOR-3 bacterium]